MEPQEPPAEPEKPTESAAPVAPNGQRQYVAVEDPNKPQFDFKVETAETLFKEKEPFRIFLIKRIFKFLLKKFPERKKGLERAACKSTLHLPQQNAEMRLDHVPKAAAQTLRRQQIHIYGRLRAWNT